MTKKQKIAIIGSGGLLGQELVSYLSLSDKSTIIPLEHGEIEIEDPESTDKNIIKHLPDIIINCAAIPNVDICEKDPDKCFGINTDGVTNILNSIKKSGSSSTFIQISSSEVFGRIKEGQYKINGYKEDEAPDPISVYQKSKTNAEKITAQFARKNPEVLKRWYVTRAGWLYGKGRKTFVESFLEALQKKDALTIVKNQWRSPTWTKDFAKGLSELINGECESGIYHIVSEVKEGEATTMDVIEEIKKYLGDRTEKTKIELVPRNELFKTPRAPSNVILNTKLPKLPYWRDSLQEYLKKYYPL